jgi:hypothetical protein
LKPGGFAGIVNFHVKRRSRDINTFSLSAIDLFACAMGAFILLSIILFQYYLKSKTVPDTPPPVPVVVDKTASLENQIEQLEEALAAAQAAAKAAAETAQGAQAKVDALKDEAAKNRQLAFLGIVTQAKSFVILIDMSGSMKDYDHLMARTVGELLGQMDNGYRCQIIGFQGHVEGEVKPALIPWQPPIQLVPMTDPNIESAKQFSNSLIGHFQGGTPTYLALRTALDYPAEAIFLMTDGEPTDIEDWRAIVRQITIKNGGTKKIFCVAIGDYRKFPDLVEFLDVLSRQNNGKFLGVSD